MVIPAYDSGVDSFRPLLKKLKSGVLSEAKVDSLLESAMEESERILGQLLKQKPFRDLW